MDMIAVKNDSAFSALIIHDIEHGTEDRIIFSYQWDGIEGIKQTRKRHSKIRYTSTGRPYFIGHGCRQYLDEFTKI